MRSVRNEQGVVTVVTLIAIAAIMLLMFATILLMATHRTYLRDTFIAHQSLQKLTDTFYEESALDMAAWVARFNGLSTALGVETPQTSDDGTASVHFTFDQTATPPESTVFVSQQVNLLNNFMEGYQHSSIGLRALTATVYIEGRPPPAFAGLSKDLSLSMLGPQVLDASSNPTGYYSFSDYLEASNLHVTEDRTAFCYPIDIWEGGAPWTTDVNIMYDLCNQMRSMLVGFIASRAGPLGDRNSPTNTYRHYSDYTKEPRNIGPAYNLHPELPGYGPVPAAYFHPLKFYGDNSGTLERHSDHPLLCQAGEGGITSLTVSGVTGSTQNHLNPPGWNHVQFNFLDTNCNSASMDMTGDPPAFCNLVSTADDPYRGAITDKLMCALPYRLRTDFTSRWHHNIERLGICNSLVSSGEIQLGGCGDQGWHLQITANNFITAAKKATQLALLQLSRMASHVYFSVFAAPTQIGSIAQNSFFLDPGDPTRTAFITDQPARGDYILFNPLWEQGGHIYNTPVTTSHLGGHWINSAVGYLAIPSGLARGNTTSRRFNSMIPLLDHNEYPNLNPNPNPPVGSPNRPGRVIFAKNHIPSGTEFLAPLEDERHPFPEWPLADRCLSGEMPGIEPFRFREASATEPGGRLNYRNIRPSDVNSSLLTARLFPTHGNMIVPDMAGVHSFWQPGGAGHVMNSPPLKEIDPATFEQTGFDANIPEALNLAPCWFNTDLTLMAGGTDTLGALSNLYDTIQGYRELPGMEESFINYLLITDGAPNLQGCSQAYIDAVLGAFSLPPNTLTCNNMVYQDLLNLIEQKLNEIEAMGRTRVFAIIIRQPNDPIGPINQFAALFDVPGTGNAPPPRIALRIDVTQDVELFKQRFVQALYLVLASFSQEMMITKKGG